MQKQSGKQKGASGAAAAAVRRNLLVTAFRRGDSATFLNGPGAGEITLEGPFTVTPGVTFELREFDRLAIYSLSQPVFIVLDVIPDDDTKLEFTINNKKTKSELSVEAHVRSTVVDDGHVTFKLKLTKEKGKLTYSEFLIDGPFRIPTNAPAPSQPFTTELKLAESVTDPVPEAVGHTQGPNSHKVPLMSSGFESKFGEALGIDFEGSPPPSGNRIELFFEKVLEPPQGQQGESIYGIGFSADRLDDDNTVRFIPLFSVEGVCTTGQRIGLNVPTTSLSEGWRIRQLPMRDLRAEPKGNNPARWRVNLENIPAKSFYDSWNCLVEDYWRALNTVRGGNPVSFLPTFESAIGDRRWVIYYVITDPTRVEDPNYVFEGTSLATISIKGLTAGPSEPYGAVLSLDQVRTHEGRPLRLRGTLSVAQLPAPGTDTEDAFSVSFSSALTNGGGDDPQQKTSRIGALDVTFADRAESQGTALYTLTLPSPARRTLAVSVQADMAIEKVVPGGQDDLPSEEFVDENENIVLPADEGARPCDVVPPDTASTAFHNFVRDRRREFNECVESRFRPKRPIIIGPPEPSAAGDRIFLQATETAKEAATQTVRLQLLNQTAAAPASQSLKSSVIVLDHNPFLVAEVRYTPFTRQVAERAAIATWTNATGDGATWQIGQNRQAAEREGPAEIILPSQGIGEEMERGYPGEVLDGSGNPTGRGFTIREGALADFRLSPPARLSVRVAEAQQSFIEAPWNLRRILGFPGQRAPGVRVPHLQFELLYGLSCDAETPFLRLAELTALIGAVPARLPLDPRWKPEVERDRLIGGEYQRMRFEWSKLYQRYLSRLAILEPWDTHVRDSLILSENVVCRIRTVDREENGVLITRTADLANPVEQETGPGLKGGVTWGFESKNIYNAVMRRTAPDQDPTSTSASVADLYFSSLGGWGRLAAGFDKDRTKIYDDVSLGRTYSYKLERIGRIACWWNRAKHVIVYERTVLPSRQFENQQVGHRGRPIVRKVREYIKILDEKRTYPDGDAELSQTERQALEKRRGFVAACSFQPGAEIAVDGSWGTDVGDIGWKIPLWNPAADRLVYPKPDIKAHLFSDVGGASQPVPCRIAEPQNVYFYTDTRAETSGDPNEWPPVRDVDYVDCPIPRPQTDFEDGNPRQTTPNDVDVPAGFGPCTFRLEPPPVPADLVAARAGKPLSAALETVTILRALLTDIEAPRASLPAGVGPSVQQALTLGSKLKTPLRDLIGPITDDETQSLADLERRVNNSFDTVDGEFNKFFVQVGNTCASVSAEISNIGTLVLDRERELFASVEKQVLDIAEKRRQEFIQEIESVLAGPANTANEIAARKRQLLTAIDQHLGELHNALILLRLSPGILQKAVSRAAAAARRFLSDTEQRINSILRKVDQYAVTLTVEELRELQVLTGELIRQVDALFAALSLGAGQSLEAWLPNPILFIVDNAVRSLLTQWKQRLTTVILSLDADTQQLTRLAASQALAIQGTWIETLRNRVSVAEQEAESRVDKWRDRLIGGGTAAPADSYIETQIAQLRAYVNNAANSPQFPRLTEFVNHMLGAQLDAAGITTENLRRRLTELNTLVLSQINDPANGLLKYAVGALNEVCAKVNNLNGLKAKVLEAINAFAGREGREIANQIRKTLDSFHADINEYANSAVGLFQRNANWPQHSDVFAAANTAMAVVRAFGRPPVVPNLQFERPVLAYFYRELQDRVDLTPVLSAVSKASAVGEALKPLGISLPTQALVEKLIPPDLRAFDLSKILPDFAGLNLKHLFPGLKMPSASNDRVKISHGADPQTRRAWIDVTVDFPVERPATIFSIGPVTIRLVNARFTAVARVEAGLGGEPPRRSARGSILADWELTIGGQTIVIFRRTEVRFDESGGLRFSLDPRNLEMPGILSFLQDFMKRFAGSDSGLSIGFVAGGVQALLNLPIPDVQVGAFGISNLRLGALLRLTVLGSDGFAITVGFNVGRKLAPFALTIFILGGGGFLEVEATYIPARRQIVCTVELGITACASLAIALGPIKGGVYVYFGITAQFRSGAGGGLTIGVMFLIRGEVSVLGIVEACISLLLEAKYTSGRLIGHGNLSIKIKICWCFTLEVSEDVTYELGGGGGSTGRLGNPELRGLTAFNRSDYKALNGSNNEPVTDVSGGIPFQPPDFQHYLNAATRYIDLLA